ncbi:transcription antitermination factor NusB [Zongyangia hominis]|uniref:Transcription antitermination protein NusB n=1 Tax=Zongyangia hominis TaxID=2763677 RepID=A0A926ECH6_9FIRM|nr:transcription antitermination factor NusB [Zongyangia hominis]MBC8569601.1 transcription antitermination factor NusB [Zongyangia hominis]
MTRSEAREQAFILVFEKSFNQQDSLDTIIENAQAGRDLNVDKFSYRLAEAVYGHLEAVDALIDKYSTKWKLERIVKVSLAILRMSISEMLYMEEVPVSVSINEAVEIAKKYATEDDASFCNGVLGAVAKDLEKIKEELSQE